jgi:hypothetical protein
VKEDTKKATSTRLVAFSEKKSGGVLLSHEVPLAVPSALRALASGFGM